MIRMGRSSKSEPINESPIRAHESDQIAVAALSNRAATEGESMARDIKEGRLSGFIGSGTVLTGDTSFQTMLRIDGHLTGSVTSEAGTLIVGSSGRVDANISVAAATINGVINGDITALEKIELGRSARVVGNVRAPRLVVEDGAILEGSCNMTKAREHSEKRPTEVYAPKIGGEPIRFETNGAPLYLESEGEGTVARFG